MHIEYYYLLTSIWWLSHHCKRCKTRMLQGSHCRWYSKIFVTVLETAALPYLICLCLSVCPAYIACISVTWGRILMQLGGNIGTKVGLVVAYQNFISLLIMLLWGHSWFFFRSLSKGQNSAANGNNNRFVPRHWHKRKRSCSHNLSLLYFSSFARARARVCVWCICQSEMVFVYVYAIYVCVKKRVFNVLIC